MAALIPDYTSRLINQQSKSFLYKSALTQPRSRIRAVTYKLQSQIYIKRKTKPKISAIRSKPQELEMSKRYILSYRSSPHFKPQTQKNFKSYPHPKNPHPRFFHALACKGRNSSLKISSQSKNFNFFREKILSFGNFRAKRKCWS